MKTRSASPPVAPVEAPSTFRFRRCIIVIFFLTQWSFYRILAYNLMIYCICSRIEALVSSFQNWGVTGTPQ
jgi:hypothetical protein